MTNIKTQKAKNIVNVENAEVVNNYYTTDKSGNKIFNKVLTRELILRLKDKHGSQKFSEEELSFVNKDNWTTNHTFLKEAQTYIGKSFIWVIGDEIRKLFVIGNDNYPSDQMRIDDYMKCSFRIYRSSLQLMNYLFISKLWDEKIKKGHIDTKKTQVSKFFNAQHLLEIKDLRLLLLELIEMFNSNPELEFPLALTEFGNIDQFLQSDSEFNKACNELEKLKVLDQEKEAYSFVHCETSEKSLTTFLSTLIFLTKYQLVSIKNIEYEESRNNKPRYIINISIIRLPRFNSVKKEETDGIENLDRHLKYYDTPQTTNSVFFRGKGSSINLFPFLIDYNALTDEDEFQLYYYECMEGKNELRYYSTKKEDSDNVFHYFITPVLEKKYMQDETRIKEFMINTRKELIFRQFEEARNAILNDNFQFTTIKSDNEDEDLLQSN